jgi:hypothetical protein
VDHRDDKQEIAHLQEMNQQLTASLGRCRSLLDACRSKLAANSNPGEHANAANDDDDEGEADQRSR